MYRFNKHFSGFCGKHITIFKDNKFNNIYTSPYSICNNNIITYKEFGILIIKFKKNKIIKKYFKKTGIVRLIKGTIIFTDDKYTYLYNNNKILLKYPYIKYEIYDKYIVFNTNKKNIVYSLSGKLIHKSKTVKINIGNKFTKPSVIYILGNQIIKRTNDSILTFEI